MSETDGSRSEERGRGAALMFGLSGVELSQGGLRDPLQHLLGEDPHELPPDVQRLKHAPVLVGTWTHKAHQASGLHLAQ